MPRYTTKKGDEIKTIKPIPKAAQSLLGMKNTRKPVKRKASGGSVKVKSGDTLSQIAKSKGVTLQALLAANPDIKNANMIRIGQTIKMPKANSVPGNTKGSPYGRMSQTQMNMLKGTKGQQEAVTSALRREVKDSGAQTTPTPKKAKEIKEERSGFKALKERAMKKKAPKKSQSEEDRLMAMGAKRGGMMKKKGYAAGGAMKKKGMKRGGAMKRSAGGTVRGAGAATRGKRFSRSG